MRKLLCSLLFVAIILTLNLPAPGQSRSIEDLLQGQTLPPGALTVLGRSVFNALESGHGNALTLLLDINDQDVQQELGLSSEETDALRALRTQMWFSAPLYANRFRSMSEEDQRSLQEDITRDLERISEKITNTLPPERQGNVQKMVFQTLGGLDSPIITISSVEALDLSADQREKMREIFDETRKERASQVDAMLEMMEKIVAANNSQNVTEEDQEERIKQRQEFDARMAEMSKRMAERLNPHLTPYQLEQGQRLTVERPAFLPNLMPRQIPKQEETPTTENVASDEPYDYGQEEPADLSEITLDQPEEEATEEPVEEESSEEPNEETAEEEAATEEEGKEEEKGPSLDAATTIEEVRTYIQQEFGKHDWQTYDSQKTLALRGEIEMPASEKMEEIAETTGDFMDKWYASQMKLSALQHLVEAEVDEAEQKLEAYLAELETKEETEGHFLINCTLLEGRFFQFQHRTLKAEVSAENIEKFKAELKTWIDRNDFDVSGVARFAVAVAEKQNTPAEPLISEMTAYIRSESCSREAKDDAVTTFERTLQTALGGDLQLYGKTMEYRDFNWNGLRGRYVLVVFTSTWSRPGLDQLSTLREAYAKYNENKGFTIVSVFVSEIGNPTEQITKLRSYVDKEKLPWIILSESLTATSNQPKQSEFYGIRQIPVSLLVDREGKTILTDAYGDRLQAKLAEIFDQ